MAGEQRIGYVRLGEVSVAYSTMGEGPPLVLPPPMFGHLVAELENPAIRAFFEALASRYTLVRYDRLGTGMSDRSLRLEARTLQFEVDVLEALVRELGLGRPTLVGIEYGGTVAAGFAARKPESVNQLVLFGPSPVGGRFPTPLLGSVSGVLQADWALGARLLTQAWFPDADRELTDWMAQLAALSCTGEMAASLIELYEGTDLRGELGRITAPTLVVQARDDPVVPVESARLFAMLIPRARFELLDGRWHQPWLGDTTAALDLIGQFLGRALPPPTRFAEPPEPALALTSREREVLQLVAQGLSDAAIAQRLVVSAHTVHRHVANIRNRLGQPSRGAAAVVAARAGLI